MRSTCTRVHTVATVAERLACSEGHVYNLVAAGRLRAVDIGLGKKRAKLRIRDDELAAYIDANTALALKGGTHDDRAH